MWYGFHGSILHRLRFPTCLIQTRIHLNAYLDKLQERAIYTDTYSVINIQNDDKPPLIECGDKLGSMTSELQPGEFIDDFVSGGPTIMLTGSSIEQIPQRHRRLYVRSGE